MAETKVTYHAPHPQFGAAVTDRKWLAGRMKAPTGFCSQYVPIEAQGHEGTSPKNSKGQPIRICTYADKCPCRCHYEIDKMYESVGMPRPVASQTEAYLAIVERSAREHDKMVEDVYRDRYASLTPSTPAVVDAPPVIEGTAPDAPPAPSAAPAVPSVPGVPVFTPTPTGRRARGQLEFNVLAVCRDFANGVYTWDECVTKLVSEEIGRREQMEPPSTGAIDAVWDRWQAIGFAERGKKPSRFIRFTGKYENMDLEIAKAKAKGEKRRTVTEQKRGSLRPRGK